MQWATIVEYAERMAESDVRRRKVPKSTTMDDAPYSGMDDDELAEALGEDLDAAPARGSSMDDDDIDLDDDADDVDDEWDTDLDDDIDDGDVDVDALG